MAKIFTDNKLYEKPWFRRLNPKMKCLWEWLRLHCDHAGVIEFDAELASFQIGAEVTIQDLKSLKNQIEILENGKIWIKGFIEFQYGELRQNYNPHKPAWRSIKKHELDSRLKQDLGKGLPTFMSKREDMREDKSKKEDEDKNKKEKENGNDIAQDVKKIWNLKIEKNELLNLSKCNALSQKRINLIKNSSKKYLKNCIEWNLYFEKISQSNFLMGLNSDWKCNFEWAIKPDNVLKVIDGQYENNKQETFQQKSDREEKQQFENIISMDDCGFY